MQEEVVRTVSEDRLVSGGGSSTTFMWPQVRQLGFINICLHSLIQLHNYVICNLQAKN